MSDAATTAGETTASTDFTPGDFLDSLRELGQALPVNYQPTAHDAGAIVSGIVWYLSTGSLTPPKVEAPDEAAERAELAEKTREDELLAQIAKLERQNAAGSVGASPVAPPPPVATPVQTPAVEPAPSGPTDATPPTSGVSVGQVPPEGGSIAQGEPDPSATQVDPAAATPSPAQPGNPAPAGESDGQA